MVIFVYPCLWSLGEDFPNQLSRSKMAIEDACVQSNSFEKRAYVPGIESYHSCPLAEDKRECLLNKYGNLYIDLIEKKCLLAIIELTITSSQCEHMKKFLYRLEEDKFFIFPLSNFQNLGGFSRKYITNKYVAQFILNNGRENGTDILTVIAKLALQIPSSNSVRRRLRNTISEIILYNYRVVK